MEKRFSNYLKSSKVMNFWGGIDLRFRTFISFELLQLLDLRSDSTVRVVAGVTSVSRAWARSMRVRLGVIEVRE